MLGRKKNKEASRPLSPSNLPQPAATDSHRAEITIDIESAQQPTSEVPEAQHPTQPSASSTQSVPPPYPTFCSCDRPIRYTEGVYCTRCEKIISEDRVHLAISLTEVGEESDYWCNHEVPFLLCDTDKICLYDACKKPVNPDKIRLLFATSCRCRSQGIHRSGRRGIFCCDCYRFIEEQDRQTEGEGLCNCALPTKPPMVTSAAYASNPSTQTRQSSGSRIQHTETSSFSTSVAF